MENDVRLTDGATIPPAAVVPSATVEFPASGAATAAASAPAVRVPGYGIERELGRGGMGVVYQARDIALDRLVALKMILAGGHAGTAELERFRTEAQAIARLQHPNIVQIHEVGEHDGLPFFSLEFCDGGGLDRKLAGTPLAPMAAAQLVETLAQAMQAAHERGVIHRDLKPANVLLSRRISSLACPTATDDRQGCLSDDFVPKITDFGLAKKLDEASQTATGTVMGTPSYMAPEQAGGKSKELGPACDIYSLGAILYECLTGRPPFRAATPLDTIMQVVSEEPVPPRQLNARVPADLETICLTCLQKEPGKRYGSAAQLAGDLRRWHTGEPITARPVGRVERGWRWCRRNPALAAALGGVAAALLVGAAVAAGFAVQAHEARGIAEKRADAEAAANRAAQAATADLEKSHDRLMTSMARSLLRPLVGWDAGVASLPLNDAEIDALWELATTHEKMRLRFVTEALRDPNTTGQLRDRAAFALQAAIELDAGRRARIEALLVERLRAKDIGENQRCDVALVLAYAGTDDPELADAVGAIVAKSLLAGGPRLYIDMRQRALGLAAIGTRLSPKEAANVGQTLVQAMARHRNLDHGELAHVLAAVAARLEHQDAERLCAAGAREVVRTMNASQAPALRALAQGLSALAARMDATEARRLCGEAAGILSRAMQSSAANIRPQLALGLSAVAAGMEAREAERACGDAALILAKDATTSDVPSYGLSAVAGRLAPRQANEVAILLAQTMSPKVHWVKLLSLAYSLSAVAAQLAPEDARGIAIALVHAMPDETDSDRWRFYAQGLSAVAARLEPEDAVRVCGRATDILLRRMSKEKEADKLFRLALAFASVAGRLQADEQRQSCAHVAATLSRALKVETNATSLAAMAQGLAKVAPLLEPAATERLCEEAAGRLTQALRKTTEPADYQLILALSALAVRLDTRRAKEAADITRQALNKQPWQFLTLLAQSLAALAGRLDVEAAANPCAAAAAALVEAIAKERDVLPPSQQYLEPLSGVLCREEVAVTRTRFASVAAITPAASDAGTLRATPVVLQTAFACPPPLPAQTLVDLLKHPCCVGDARTLVLGQLTRHYGRPFADQWDFVRFAAERRLPLDLTTPPQRPGANPQAAAEARDGQ